MGILDDLNTELQAARSERHCVENEQQIRGAYLLEKLSRNKAAL